MKTIILFIKRHLELNLHEARSVIAGVGIIILLSSLIWISDAYTKNRESELILTVYDNLEVELEKLKYEKQSTRRDRKKVTIIYQEFNPNTASKDVLIKNGIPSFLAQRLLNFRKAGMVFKQTKDLLKIYGFEEDLLAKLLPYIQLPILEKKVIAKKLQKPTIDVYEEYIIVPKPYEPIEAFDINIATKEDLKQIYGIGEVFASRIIKYRDALGGFHDLEQIKNTYGLADSTFNEIIKVTFIAYPHHKVKINIIELENWKTNLLKQYQKRAILAYRDNHGPFHSKIDLEKLIVLDSSQIEQIAPYLDYNLEENEQ